MEMISNMNGTHYDELIGGTAVPVLTKNVTLKGLRPAISEAHC